MYMYGGDVRCSSVMNLLIAWQFCVLSHKRSLLIGIYKLEASTAQITQPNVTVGSQSSPVSLVGGLTTIPWVSPL